MSIFKTLTCNIGSYYYFLREIISPSLIRDAKEIPIIINNFNRLTTLRLLTETLTACGYTNIYILDNASTYPPLLEYYKTCPFTVFHLNQNLGFKALWESPLKKRFCNDYYIYTDSDVIPSDYCPKDFIDYFFKELKKHPFARKIGFSLRIDNIPDSYTQRRSYQFRKTILSQTCRRRSVQSTNRYNLRPLSPSCRIEQKPFSRSLPNSISLPSRTFALV